jgi:UPF0271 protein
MTASRRIDFNLDLGEGFGTWSRDNDEAALLELASSVNIACGFHAGDPGQMRLAVERAAERGIAVGAHPGLPDLRGFGRRPMALSPAEVRDDVTYQIGSLLGFTGAAGCALHHVKLHGSLATQCNTDSASAAAFASAVAGFGLGERLPIYTDPSSAVWTAGPAAGVPVVAEFYADMPLGRDGRRVAGDAARHGRHSTATPASVRARVRDVLEHGSVDAVDGGRVEVEVRTISVHSDGAEAVELARAVVAGIGDAGWERSADLAGQNS